MDILARSVEPASRNGVLSRVSLLRSKQRDVQYTNRPRYTVQGGPPCFFNRDLHNFLLSKDLAGLPFPLCLLQLSNSLELRLALRGISRYRIPLSPPVKVTI